MPKMGAEKEAVQNPLISYGTEIGWHYLSPDEALRLRGGKSGLILKELFINQIQRINPNFMDHLLAEELILKFEHIRPTIEGNLHIWEYLKGLKTVYIPQEKRERNVTLIDTENIDKNTFHVTDEFTYSNGDKTIRQDIVFLINGIPILFIETKSATKIDGITRALDQIEGYHTRCPELLAILQLYAVTHLISYFYSATWNMSKRYLFNWKEEVEGDFETLVKLFLDRKRIIKILTDFILFTQKDDELSKVILRPHQMRAVDNILLRAQNKEKHRGLIWHTQGSGKTYTMIVTAQKILENPLFENPTIIMLVDRNELESQLFENLSSVGFEVIHVARSKKHLRNLLQQDTRGFIVTMIHKFEDMPENINTRENIFVLVDEAHRTTGGRLGNYLMGALPNATYIGFTGTPIDKTSYGEGTFTIFGRDDPPLGYLDKYSISESIEDGTTVPLHYSMAPNELLVDKETLNKEFLELQEAQGVSDFEELDKVLEKAVNLKNMLKNPERMDRVAEYIADHYKQYIESMGYKAFVVAVDREACALYKTALDKYLPSELSTVIYSPYHGDPPEMSQYHLSKKEEKRVRKSFKNPDELPKILIVTQKLLTGFDAPILYCMYLDKPMRDHTLLQAIARVNRPYEDDAGNKKPSGFVLDFVGIFDNLEKALAFDSRDVEGVVKDIQVLKEKFLELMEEAKRKYLGLISGYKRDKAVEAVLEHFLNEDIRLTYYEFFKKLQTIYDIISPDAFLRPYLKDFERLAEMYRILKSAYEPHILVDKEFSNKTAELVREYTKGGTIGLALEIFEINEDMLRKIEESTISDTEKVFNLLKSIEKVIELHGDTKPYLLSIGERAEIIAELYKNRQKTTQQTLDGLKILIEEINKAKHEEVNRKMSTETFSIFWLLNNEKISNPEKYALQMEEILEKYPFWKKSESHERESKKRLNKILLEAGLTEPKEISRIVQTIMRVLKGGEE